MLSSGGVNLRIFNQTITILNKLKATDSITNQDVWRKTILHNAYWSKKTVSAVSGTTTSVSEVVQVQIPFSENYKQYKQWKQSGEQDGFYTMSLNDYIIYADVEEEVTASTIKTVTNKYGDDVCSVRAVKECYSRIGEQSVQLMIEGV